MSELSDELQVLAAGYVLGDLSSAEMAEFQAQLSTNPQLVQAVTDLQETLSLLPYGLQQQQPDPRVRSQLLQAAQPVMPVPHRPRIRIGALVATLVAIALGGCSLGLWLRVIDLEIRLASAQRLLAMDSTEPKAAPPMLTISPPEAVMSQQWSGLAALIDDHRKAQGLPSTQALPGAGDLQIAPLPEAMPTLDLPQAELVSSSNCQFDNAQGFRTTYRLRTEGLVSVYRIDLSGDHFPELTNAYVTLNYQGINLVFWKEANYLYALTASMPLSNLQTLAQSLESI
ncbi:MAG: hypothetical protein AAFQ61_05125 [Cyanobacteria bacterium J06626_23]